MMLYSCTHMATVGVNGLSVLKHAAHLLAKHGEFDYNMYCVREMEKSSYIVLYINSVIIVHLQSQSFSWI